MAADALSRPSRSQKDESDIDDDIPAYAAANIHASINKNAEEKVAPIEIQTFLVAQKNNAICHLLAKNAKAPDSQSFHEKFSILLRRAELDKAAKNVIPLSQ